MSEPRRAVFLSYAREDADAARRIADALRAFGLEVWFDQNELRGGDVWDAKIRKQIHECGLFVPVISAATQARPEGYFRREWRLGVERTRDMSANVAFVAPVVIDDTGQAAADVPEEFMRYQWTHLAHGVPTPQFVEQVTRLIEQPRRSGQISDAGNRIPGKSEDRGQRSEDGPRTKPRMAGRIGAVAGFVVAIGIGGFFALRPARETVAPTGNSKLQTPNSELSNSRVADSKSIAVLPFANLSDDKDASAFFSDGIHEDILTSLSNIRELRVVSRTSVLGYRGTTKKIAEIAKELGVAFILEGSVRRTGNKVRVTGQLIRAASDEHLWAKNFDRDLTDIFAIQSELSQAIATELKAALSPEEKKLIEQRPTQNMAAYELVLKAREDRNRRGQDGFETQQELLRSALQLDPNYAAAYAERSYLFAFRVFGDESQREWLEQSKEALDQAIRLAPDSPDVIRATGDYYYYGRNDFQRALRDYETVRRLRPNDAQVYNRIASVQRRLARWTESLANFRKAKELDPADLNNVGGLGQTLAAARRYEEARAEYLYILSRRYDLESGYRAALLPFLATGSSAAIDEFLGGLTPAQLASPAGRDIRIRLALRRGNIDEALRVDRESPSTDAAVVTEVATALAVRGDREAASRRLASLPDDLRHAIESGRTDGTRTQLPNLARMTAVLGRRDEALQYARKAVDSLPVTRDAAVGATYQATLAFVLAWTGEKEAAINQYAAVLRTPFGTQPEGAFRPDFSVHVMKRDPRFAPLRGDPRFEALLNDPKNNAPLF